MKKISVLFAILCFVFLKNSFAGEVISAFDNSTLPVMNEELRKLDISNQILEKGKLDLHSEKIENLATPTATTDATTKVYVDDAITASGFIDRGDPSAADKTSWTTNGNWQDWDLSSIVPAGARAVVLYVSITDDNVGSSLSFRENGNSNNYNINSIIMLVADRAHYATMIVPVSTARVIEYVGSNVTFTAITAIVIGWFM